MVSRLNTYILGIFGCYSTPKPNFAPCYQTSPKLNLDTTTMIAYVSAMTNGDNQYTYDVIPLNQHRDAEERKEVKPILEFFFEGKKLYCCETAVNVFKKILDTLGGTHEKVRAGQLMKNIEIIADCMSDRVKELVLGGKIKERSRTVFGTGDAIKAVTVTANEGFYRAAKNQGVELAVFIHESRSLSEVASKRAQPRY